MLIEGAPEKLGCPVDEVRTVTAVTQDFERGILVWREDEGLIYVVYDAGGWEAYPDAWQEGMPETDPAFGPPPDGKIQPRRGFGLVWAEQQGVREALGWALNEERSCDDAHVQPFEGGLGFSCTHDVVPGAKIYVFTFYDDFSYGLYLP